MAASLKQRVRAIQRKLGVTADGVIGPVTLSKIEDALGVDQSAHCMCVSKKGVQALMRFEIGSKAHYTKRLAKPIWPGGGSGVTIGIGYDLGYMSKTRVREDWAGLLPDAHIEKLAAEAGKKKVAAKNAVARLRRSSSLKIPLKAAEQVFYERTLPRYAQRVQRIYPGVEDLPADAQAMLLSLVYNRGAALSGARRREMKAIQRLVKKKDLKGIAEQFVAMKRLWEGKGLDGLLKRRDQEARMISKARRRYTKKEKIFV